MEISKHNWPDSWKWIMGFISSALIAGLTAWLTVTFTLQNKIDEGQAIFDGIGYRYFSAVVGVYDQKTLRPHEDLDVWKAYREIISDIREDIRWLRTNPLYGEIQEETAGLLFAQNFLTAESVRDTTGRDTTGVEKNTLHFMCEIYIKSGRWKEPPSIDQTTRELWTFAQHLCNSTAVPKSPGEMKGGLGDGFGGGE